MKNIFMGSLVILLLLGCTSSLSKKALGKSYLILDAEQIDGSKQPTWVAVSSRRGSIHIPTGGVVTEIDPGNWVIDHFDFAKSMQSGTRTRYASSKIRFKVEAGKIYYLGMLAFSEKKATSVGFSLVGDPSLLQRACSSSPELFKKYSMTFLFRDEETKTVTVDCDGILP